MFHFFILKYSNYNYNQLYFQLSWSCPQPENKVYIIHVYYYKYYTIFIDDFLDLFLCILSFLMVSVSSTNNSSRLWHNSVEVSRNLALYCPANSFRSTKRNRLSSMHFPSLAAHNNCTAITTARFLPVSTLLLFYVLIIVTDDMDIIIIIN